MRNNTGTSGLSLNDQFQVMDQVSKGTLNPGRSVGAIGGMNVAKEGINQSPHTKLG